MDQEQEQVAEELKLVACEEDGPLSAEEEAKREEAHFQSIVDSFRNYKNHSMESIRQQEVEWLKVHVKHRELLPNYRQKFVALRAAVETNYKLISKILARTNQVFQPDPEGEEPKVATKLIAEVADPDESGVSLTSSPMNMEKVQCTLRQFVRDWSQEGKDERMQSYGVITEELQEYFKKIPKDMRHRLKVLVPGAGLGRLLYDITRLGFSAQGNEFSYHMLLASEFILNEAKAPVTIQPWIHQNTNVRCFADQIRSITIPDEIVAPLPAQVGFSMTAGDFLQVYANQHNCWHAVTTCFFLDTAHNVIQYIHLISQLLVDGGVWINLGPLLYHWSGIPGEHSIELTLEEILSILPKFSLTLIKKEDRQANYTMNCRSMMRLQYDCVLLVIRKTSKHQK